MKPNIDRARSGPDVVFTLNAREVFVAEFWTALIDTEDYENLDDFHFIMGGKQWHKHLNLETLLVFTGAATASPAVTAASSIEMKRMMG